MRRIHFHQARRNYKCKLFVMPGLWREKRGSVNRQSKIRLLCRVFKSAKILFYISVESQFLEALNFSQTLLILLPKHSCHLRLGAGGFYPATPSYCHSRSGSRIFLRRGPGAPLRNGTTDWWRNSKWRVQFSSETEGGTHRSEAKSTGYPWIGHVAMMHAERLLWPIERILCQTTNLWHLT